MRDKIEDAIRTTLVIENKQSIYYVVDKIIKLTENLRRRGVTDAQADAENFVNDYLLIHDKPPTYQKVADYFKITKTAAYMRLKNYRSKMKRHG